MEDYWLAVTYCRLTDSRQMAELLVSYKVAKTAFNIPDGQAKCMALSVQIPERIFPIMLEGSGSTGRPIHH